MTLAENLKEMHAKERERIKHAKHLGIDVERTNLWRRLEGLPPISVTEYRRAGIKVASHRRRSPRRRT